MKIVTGTKFPSATAFSGDEEVQEYIHQALAEDGTWFEQQTYSGADVIQFFTSLVKNTSNDTIYIWIHPERESFIYSFHTPKEIVEMMNDMVDEAEEQVDKWKKGRK